MRNTRSTTTTGSIKGRVRDENDVPIEDVSIVIKAGPTHSDIAALTSSDGAFAFSNLRPGNYVLKAFSNDMESDDIAVRVFARKTAFVEIWLESDSVLEKNNDEESNVVDEI